MWQTQFLSHFAMIGPILNNIFYFYFLFFYKSEDLLLCKLHFFYTSLDGILFHNHLLQQNLRQYLHWLDEKVFVSLLKSLFIMKNTEGKQSSFPLQIAHVF